MAGIAGAAPVTEATLGAPPNDAPAAPPGAGPPANAPIVSSVGERPLAAAAAGSGPAAFPSTGAAASAEEEAAAATRIQATFKGKKARAEFAASRESSPRKAAALPAAASSSAAAAAPVARVANPRADFLVSAAATFGAAADPSSASVSRWAAFAGTAIASLVPAAPSGLLRAPGPPRGYKITIGAVESYAFGPEAYRASSRGGVLEARVALSFYDETAGSFHGRTCSSAPRAIRLPPAAGDGPGAMPVGTLDCGPHEAFFVTRVADPRCLIVAEIVIVERDATSGAVVRETTGGWAAIPSRGANGEEPPATASPPGGEPASTAPMRAGSPRYLMWGRPRAGQHPPSPLGAAKLRYSYEACDVVAAPRCAALLPEDAFFCSREIIPGLHRVDARTGRLTSAGVGDGGAEGSAALATPLARPTLAPTRKVALRGVRVALPAPFATLVAASPATAAALGADPGSAPPNVRALAQNPAACAAAVASARCVSVRVQAHNGRRFVGDAVVVDAFEGAPGPGPEPAIGVRAPVVLDGVPQDQLVALVVEVLFRPPGSDPRAAPACVGWAATAPFCEKNPPSKIAPPTLAEAEATADANRVVAFDGGLDVAAGPRAFAFASVRGPRAAACADWRAVVRAPPEAWRDAAGPRGADAGGFRATFELAVAPGDVDVEAKHRELVAAAKQRDADLARAPSVDVAASALAKVSTAAGGGGGSPAGGGGSAAAAASAPPPPPAGGIPAPGAPAIAAAPSVESAHLDALASRMEEQTNRMEEMLRKAEATLATSEKANAGGAAASASAAGARRDDDDDDDDGREWPAEGPAAMPRDAARALFGGDGARGADESGRSSSDGSDRLAGSFGRATRARLHAAGADATLPPDVRLALRAGAAADQARRAHPSGRKARVDLAKEHADMRAVNEVIVQFLAYRRLDALNAGAGDFRDAHFTFHFFDFPASTSRSCALVPADAAAGEPQLLVPEGAAREPMDPNASAASAGSVASRAGEAWFKFAVDGGGAGAGDAECEDHEAMHARRKRFVHYLANEQLHVDVWDGRSLMQHGTCAIDLDGLLRQGRESAEVIVEASVVDHREATARERDAGAGRRAALGAAKGTDEPAGVARGKLLVRLINVGRRPDKRLLPPEEAPAEPLGAGVERSLRATGANSVRVRAVPETGGRLAAALKGGAKVSSPLPGENVPPSSDTNGRAKSLLARRGAPAAAAGDRRGALREQEARKLAREARLREIRGGADTTGVERDPKAAALAVSSATSDERAVRNKLLGDIDSARRRVKRESVLQKLRAQTSGRVVLRPCWGEACFFERAFRNPEDRDCVFEVRCDDPDVSLVASAAECDALRGIGAMGGGGDVAGSNPRGGGAKAAEDSQLAGNRLFLLAGESVSVPFKFQSFDADGVADGSAPGAPDEGLHLRPRMIAVHFVNAEDGTSAGALTLDVKPRAQTVQRTMRFQAAEWDFFKTRLPPPPGVRTRDDDGRVTLAVRASDPAVAAAIAADAGDESGMAAEEITLRYKCGGEKDAAEGSSPGDSSASASAPRPAGFFVCVYADRFLARLVATWRVFVHAVPRVDVSATVGQTSHAGMVVQGGSGGGGGETALGSRRLAAFSSHPDELRVSPDRLSLSPGALAEVHLAFRPLVPGRADVVVHLVDLENRRLVHSRVVATDARGPSVSKTFDVAAVPGARSHKKITYTNPYPRPRAFNLRCTHPLLLHFRPETLELGANASKPMGLTFEPAEAWAKAASAEAKLEGAGEGGGKCANVLVFINDEEDATEECFRVRVGV